MSSKRGFNVQILIKKTSWMLFYVRQKLVDFICMFCWAKPNSGGLGGKCIFGTKVKAMQGP